MEQSKVHPLCILLYLQQKLLLWDIQCETGLSLLKYKKAYNQHLRFSHGRQHLQEVFTTGRGLRTGKSLGFDFESCMKYIVPPLEIGNGSNNSRFPSGCSLCMLGGTY